MLPTSTDSSNEQRPIGFQQVPKKHFWNKSRVSLTYQERLVSVSKVAVESMKIYNNFQEAQSTGWLGKLYKKCFGHERWIPVQIETKGNNTPQFIKVNYKSLQKHLFADDKSLTSQDPTTINQQVQSKIKDRAYQSALHSLTYTMSAWENLNKNFFEDNQGKVSKTEEIYTELEAALSGFLAVSGNTVPSAEIQKTLGKAREYLHDIREHLLDFVFNNCMHPLADFEIKENKELLTCLKSQNNATPWQNDYIAFNDALLFFVKTADKKIYNIPPKYYYIINSFFNE